MAGRRLKAAYPVAAARFMPPWSERHWGHQMDWQVAHLLPTAGIGGAKEQEQRATSALLAVMRAVPEFGKELVSELGLPRGRISTYTEVCFEDDSGSTVRPDGAIVALIGPNGAGKTTTFAMLSGFLHPDAGTVRFRGEDITVMKPHTCTRMGLSYVPQLDNVFQNMSVKENLEMGAFLVRDRSKIERSMREAFEIFPILGERSGQLGGTLSGGEQQMLAIARALMLEPKILLLDEPSLGLAPLFVARIFDVVRALQERGIAILLVEQNAQMALRTADRAYVLETGSITREGPARELLDDPAIREAYLGA